MKNVTIQDNEQFVEEMQEVQKEQEPISGLRLLRDQLLPNLLGEEHSAILYWAGKELARQHPLENEAATIQFFHTYGFGTLTQSSAKKQTVQYILSGDIVLSRMESKEPSFSLEAGFLAQQHQLQQNIYSEASFEFIPRKKLVRLVVQTDKKAAL